MGKVTASVPLLVVIAYLLQGITGNRPCGTKGINGIKGCECNIMEACDDQGKPRSNWAEYLPTGVEQFGLVERVQNLAYLCEGGTVAILYDCNSRIPLYAATMISGAQLSAATSGGRPKIGFRNSEGLNGLDPSFQQKKDDYNKSNKRELCYKRDAKEYKIDDEWLRSVNKRLNSDVCPRGSSYLQTEMNKGHLIASQYGYGNKERMKATFTYTNVVPQFATFNQGPWKDFENLLIKWGKNNCNVKGALNVQMFIVVGAIPSTNFGKRNTRYFGMEGFSDYEHQTYYPVNVPRYMWTAACCKYTVNGTLKYNSTAFMRQNHPGDSPCNRLDVGRLSRWLFSFLRRRVRTRFNLFPDTPQCYDKNNFIPLR